MKKIFYYAILIFILSCITMQAQEPDTLTKSRWNHDIEAWNYFHPDNSYIFSPIYGVDKGWLHLEARYNYEALNTFSAWFGYNFDGGNKFQYTITPLVGGLVGDVNGIAPGLELDFNFFGFNFNSTSQYIFDLEGKENDFFYNWTDFIYAPIDWVWFGISYQRTQLYQSKLDFQYGPMLGGGYKWIGLTAYWYNPGSVDPYIVLYLSITLPSP